jgi:hypothetical protein
MLESVVKRYHNNQIDSAQVLQELSEIAKEMMSIFHFHAATFQLHLHISVDPELKQQLEKL